MTEIKRFVSYIYMYNNGVKESNVGFAKVDSRNGQCKIAVNIKGLEQSNGKCEKVYLFYRNQKNILGIYIGSFKVINGIGEFHEQFQTQNIKDTNLSLDEMNGILVREEDKNERIFASGWDDYAILIDQFCIHNNETTNVVLNGEEKDLLHASEVEEQRKEPIIFFDRDWKEESGEKEQVEEERVVEVEEEKLNIDKITLEEKTQVEVQSMNEEEKIEKKQEDFERDVKRKEKMDKMQKEDEEQKQTSELMQQAEGVETVIVENVNGERSITNIHNKRNEIKQEEEKQQSIKSIEENGLLWSTPAPSVWKEMSWEEYQEKEQQLRKQVQICINQKKEQNRNLTEQMSFDEKQQEVNPTEYIKQDSNRCNIQQDEKRQNEEMQRAEETIWDRLCHQFPKIRAFVDEPESLCLKIDLRDLRMLPQENWVLGSNSFLLHGYYNFRYLILTQEDGEFVLGIPGIYHPNEKMMASMFGFGGFKPVKVCDKMLGQFGYWYKRVSL